jgi:threonine/homoserine/homoserine lactone efflux protein
MLPTLMAFATLCAVMSIAPGPDVMFLVTQTLRHGRQSGLVCVVAVALGSLINAGAASLGLAAVFAASTIAFTVVKMIGAAYLVFLGCKTLRTKSTSAASGDPERAPLSRLFRDGFFVALFNPKTTLFFAALLPQFVLPNGSPLSQSCILACVFVAIAACTDSAYVFTASALALEGRSRRWSYGRYLSAASLIGLGIYAALESPRSAR